MALSCSHCGRVPTASQPQLVSAPFGRPGQHCSAACYLDERAFEKRRKQQILDSDERAELGELIIVRRDSKEWTHPDYVKLCGEVDELRYRLECAHRNNILSSANERKLADELHRLRGSNNKLQHDAQQAYVQRDCAQAEFEKLKNRGDRYSEKLKLLDELVDQAKEILE